MIVLAAGDRLDALSLVDLSVVQLVQKEPGTYRLEGATLLRASRDLPSFEARLSFAQTLLDTLTPDMAGAEAASA